jgi:hypothetical protein
MHEFRRKKSFYALAGKFMRYIFGPRNAWFFLKISLYFFQIYSALCHRFLRLEIFTTTRIFYND